MKFSARHTLQRLNLACENYERVCNRSILKRGLNERILLRGTKVEKNERNSSWLSFNEISRRKKSLAEMKERARIKIAIKNHMIRRHWLMCGFKTKRISKSVRILMNNYWWWMKCDVRVATWGRHSMSFFTCLSPCKDGEIKKGKWRQQKAIINFIFYFNVFLNVQSFFQEIKIQRGEQTGESRS